VAGRPEALHSPRTAASPMEVAGTTSPSSTRTASRSDFARTGSAMLRWTARPSTTRSLRVTTREARARECSPTRSRTPGPRPSTIAPGFRTPISSIRTRTAWATPVKLPRTADSAAKSLSCCGLCGCSAVAGARELTGRSPSPLIPEQMAFEGKWRGSRSLGLRPPSPARAKGRCDGSLGIDQPTHVRARRSFTEWARDFRLMS
jgi:hypothetical protein